MGLHNPTHTEMAETARALGLHLTDAEIDEYLQVMAEPLAAYALLDAAPDDLPLVKYPRTPGFAPEARDNPYNAWYHRCEIHGASDGPLRGKTVAIKDHACVAGVPMMNGSSTLRGYVPDVDATIVTRILDAGGTILGKSSCELYCVSGGSHTNSLGPVINPRKPGYSAGGSSSGSAVLVATGEVDMATGGDQAGSIRNPASFCGVVGMKPTHGLVPYTGAVPLEATIDHVGPITATVADNALLLSVLAGSDGLDPRQVGVRTADYVAALEEGVDGLRIGVVREGFDRPWSEPDVDALVRKAAAKFENLGAKVDEVSIPMHSTLAPAVWLAICLGGWAAKTVHGNVFGFDWKGLHIPSLLSAFVAASNRVDETSEPFKMQALLGLYMMRRHHGLYYARAQNLARRVTAAYDAVLQSHDVLLMPTSSMKATPLPPPDAGIAETCRRATEMLWNTCPFNVTGHPALSMPCGTSEGLPVGMMLVGRHWDEATIYRAAKAFEANGTISP